MHTYSPVPEITWWKNDKEQIPSEHLTHYGKVLTFSELTVEDAGEYYCQAMNEEGTSKRHSFSLDVEGIIMKSK